jgi:hypothetical protein
MKRGRFTHLSLLGGVLALTAGLAGTARAAELSTTPVGVQVLPGTGRVLVTFGTVPKATGYNIYRREATFDTPGTAAKVNTDPVPYAWFIDDGGGQGLPNGTNYYYSVKAVIGGAEGPASGEALGMPQVPIGDGFMLYYLDNGPPAAAPILPTKLTLDTATDTLTIESTGADIWDNQDRGGFLARPVTGDYSITVKVLEKPQPVEPNTSNNVKIGPMIRDTLFIGSRYAYLHTTSARGVLWERRTGWNGTGTNNGSNPVSDEDTKYPLWLRLTKEGAVISASQSNDGVTFTQEGDETTTEDYERMNDLTFAGIAFISSNADGKGLIKVGASSIKIQ